MFLLETERFKIRESEISDAKISDTKDMYILNSDNEVVK